jgi:hypothetical protein
MYILMSSVSSNLLPFSVDIILGCKKKSGGGDFILDSLVLPKTAVLILQCEVSRCQARGTGFRFPETEVSLDEFFEPSQRTLPHNIP